MGNVVLVGMPGSGKSATGQILAGLLGVPFVDTDSLIAAEAGQGIAAIFAREGEAGFRRREAKVVARVLAGSGQVVATGGGAPLDPVSRARIRQQALVVWLQVTPAEVVRRTGSEGGGRPLLAGGEALVRAEGLLAARAPVYAEAAHWTLLTDGREVAAVAEEIAGRVAARLPGFGGA